jgi:aromatic ring-opening dioxygenase catalytic subunit (LigB family)
VLSDYVNFPAHTYELQFPAPGAPALAAPAAALLKAAGIESGTDPARGFDHGVFVPLLKITPDASSPVLEMSVCSDLDPARHLAIGRAPAPLREEGVLMKIDAV